MKTIATLILTLASGTIVIEKVIPDVVNSSVPVFFDAIAWQENTVKTAEYLELSCAEPARAEWEINKAKAYQRIEEFKSLVSYESETE
jgi:hypothetical protein